MQWTDCLAVMVLLGALAAARGAVPATGAAAAQTDPNAPLDETAYPAGVRIKVACVGDSITAGSGTTAPAGASNAYPMQLQRMLEATWPGRFEVKNFGVGGTTLLAGGDKPYTKQGAYGASKAFAADVVVLMLGTNDTKPQNWKLKAEFAGEMKQLVGVYAGLASKPRVFVCRPCFVPVPGNFGISEAALLEELPLIDGVAREMRLGVIDIHGATKERNELFADHVHPNNEGAGVLAKTVYRGLTGKEYAGAGTIIAVAATGAGASQAK